MYVNNIQHNQSINFGMTYNNQMVQSALKNVEPSLKECIQQGVDSFCDVTAKKGIDGKVRIKRVISNKDGDFLEYSLRPSVTGRKLNNKIELKNIQRGNDVLTLADSIKTQMLDGIGHLFKNV